jgi:hypothetical protein
VSVRRIRPALALGAAALLALAALAGCGSGKYTGVLPANQRPEIELTQVPASTTEPYFYAYEVRWAGFDSDGGVDHYLYCVDPPVTAESDTPWVSTTANRQTFYFRSEHVDSAGALTGRGWHTLVVKAVDNGGLASAPATRSFSSFTIAPTVQFVSPQPNHLFTPKFGPSFRLVWKGDDPDGRGSRRPVKYKYKVFDSEDQELDFITILLKPDTLRTRYGPSFSTWDSVGGDTTQVDLHDLRPGVKVAVIVAFDEAGAFSPVFTVDVNLFVFQVTYEFLGPTLTVFNETFYYKYPGPTFSLNPADFVTVDQAADQPLSFKWSGTTNNSGTYVAGYRWRVDGDIADETPRANESTDIGHWSRWSALTTGCSIAPISPPPGQYAEPHFFYLEAKDSEGRLSLAVVNFTVVRPRFDRDLLIVDDTRLKIDTRLSTGAYARPSGAWPTAAELDTFFFAAGGKPWREYPAGTVSPPGAFLGYDYDTIATRFQPGGTLSLGDLGRYRHILWYVDYKSSTNVNPIDYARDPMPLLHGVSFPGKSNPLAIWIEQGGKAWLFGGGIASCLQREWEKTGSNALVYSSADGELAPGRFMYDLAHWRSEVSNGSSGQAVWSTAGAQPWPGMPDYSSLPSRLREKSAATDPFAVYAPNRTNQGEFYQVTYAAEAITKANTIVQDADPDPNTLDMRAVLDTLYASSGGSLGSGRPVMTLYHGGENAPLVFSGFPVWYFQRAQSIAMVDWVLQKLWGLPRRPVAR